MGCSFLDRHGAGGIFGVFFSVYHVRAAEHNSRGKTFPRLELVEKLDKLQKGQQSRTAEPDAPVSPFGLRVAVPASRCAPWSGACALRPPPLLRLAVSAAGGARLHSLRQNFTANRAIGLWPPTQFAVKFPCMCCQRRRMSAAGNGFLIFFDSLQRGDFPPAVFRLRKSGCGPSRRLVPGEK